MTYHNVYIMLIFIFKNQFELDSEFYTYDTCVGRRPASSRQMANSRGKHTRHNSYQLTNTRTRHTKTSPSRSHELERPEPAVCFSFYFLWNLIFNFIPTGAWMLYIVLLALAYRHFTAVSVSLFVILIRRTASKRD